MKPSQKTRYLPPGLTWLFVGTIFFFAQLARGQTTSPSILFTADNEGHVEACANCPMIQGQGGMDRRATALASLRGSANNSLLIDGGNSFFGGDSADSRGQVIVAAFNALHYDAMNLSWRDFHYGKQRTLELIKGAQFDVISANLIDDVTGQLLAKPFVIKTVGGKKIALIGLTQRPAAIDVLPTLRQELVGVRIDPPEKALADILPKAKAAADSVVLVYYGSNTEARALFRRFGPELSAMLVGGIRPDELAEADSLIAVTAHGTSIVRCHLIGPGKKPAIDAIAMDSSIAPDAGMTRLLAQFAPKPTETSTTRQAVAAMPLPESLKNDGFTAFAASGSSRAVNITIDSVGLLSHFGDAVAPQASKFLLINTTFQNLLAPQLIKGKLVPVAYRIPELYDHIYVVADGRLLRRNAGAALFGELPPGSMELPQAGSSTTGKLVLSVPAGFAPNELAIHYLDSAYGNVVIPLVQNQVADAKPVFPPQKNEVIEAAIYSVNKPEQIHGVGAPAGLTYLVANFRARSTVTNSVDARTFDPQAAAGAKTVVDTVADWKESRKYLQLIVDGEHAWPATDLTELAKEPRFLPDVFTGGDVVFLIPEKHTSLELRCDFPNAKLTTGKIIRPAGLTTLLEGTRPVLTPRTAVASVKDEIFDVSIVEQSASGEFAGIHAPAAKKYLVLDVTVKNLGKQQEFFQTVEQLKHVDEKGAASPIDKVSYSGLRRPLEQIYIPDGEQRTFQLVYQVPVAETKPRLAYASVTKGGSKVLILPKIDTATPVADASIPVLPVGTSTQPGNTPTAPQRAPADKDPRAAPVSAKQNRKALGLEGVGLKAEAVNLAIDRGSKALWESIRDEDLKGSKPVKFGSKPEHVLAMLALVNSGAHKKIPEFDSALRDFLKEVQPKKLRTYEVGLLAMLIEAYGDGEFGPKMEEAARHILETQGTKGTWNYVILLPDAVYKKDDIPAATQPAAVGSTQEEAPILLLRRSPRVANYDGDNSNTQYAILGLSAASRTGIKVDQDSWRRTLQTTLDRQETSGGWSYHEKGQTPAYGSMTAAGICAVALCRHELGATDPGKDEAIETGLGWLVANFSVTEHPKSSEWLYYYIYSIERVGRILDTEFIGQYEWYPLGAEHLVQQQRPGGLWVGKGYETNPRLASSFALLFLTRATPSLNLKQKLRPAAPPPPPAIVVAAAPMTRPVAVVVKPPPVIVVKPKLPGTLRAAAVAPMQNFYIILDASGSMLEEMDGKQKFDIARDSVRSLVNALPSTCNVALRVYGHRKQAIEPRADEDTELKIRMAPLNKEAFNAALDSLRPRGKTPLALSLEEAVKDLGQGSLQKPVTLLLLTDGGEDTQPRRDPLQAAELVAGLKSVQFHIVGFDINQPDWAEQLQGMARRGNGRYWPAARAADLEHGILRNVLGLPEQYTVLDLDGHELSHSAFAQPTTLPEGKYRLQAIYAGERVEREFSVSAGATTVLTLNTSQSSIATGTAAIPGTTRPAEPVTEIVKRFCSKCGAPLAPGAKFCEKCGTKIDGTN